MVLPGEFPPPAVAACMLRLARNGAGYAPVTVCGARAGRGFTLHTKGEDGTLAKVDQSSKVGRDWWQADFDAASKTWDITYTISLDTPGDTRAAHRFVWRMDEPEHWQKRGLTQRKTGTDSPFGSMKGVSVPAFRGVLA